jgi:hypothetical protein
MNVLVTFDVEKATLQDVIKALAEGMLTLAYGRITSEVLVGVYLGEQADTSRRLYRCTAPSLYKADSACQNESQRTISTVEASEQSSSLHRWNCVSPHHCSAGGVSLIEANSGEDGSKAGRGASRRKDQGGTTWCSDFGQVSR